MENLAKKALCSDGCEDDVPFILRDEILAKLKSWRFMTGGWESGLDEELESRLRIPEGDKFENYLERLKEKRSEQETREAEMSAVEKELNSSTCVGAFVRIVFGNVPLEWVDRYRKFDGSMIPIIGGISDDKEKNLTFMNSRVKKHRWAKRVLKTSEPLLFSVGWRRFQSIPYYCIEDRNSVRLRYLKYTPEHMHCQMVFYGFTTPPGAGLLAMKHIESDIREYRISLSGVILENLQSPKILKKLKLLGEASEIKKHTCFVKNMFNSDLEVARCENVPIQTQSGIRGMIKKARGVNGEYRATFEAPIRKNDLIICKAWFKVPLEPFCNPAIDLPSWDRLRTFAEIRHGKTAKKECRSVNT